MVDRFRRGNKGSVLPKEGLYFLFSLWVSRETTFFCVVGEKFSHRKGGFLKKERRLRERKRGIEKKGRERRSKLGESAKIIEPHVKDEKKNNNKK